MGGIPARLGIQSIAVAESFHYVQYGTVAALFYVACRRFADARRVALPFLVGIVVGVLDEWVQWLVPLRVGELHDVALNAAAVMAGLLAAVAIDRPAWSVFRVGRGAPAITVAATVMFVALAGFVYCVHFGYEIRDVEAGTFRSRYDASTLRLTAVDRARVWRDGPPVYASRYAPEDQYYAEALWHVRERNEAVAAGDVFTAWHEQLILEQYFAPAVRLPEHRWSPEQRANIERAARGSTGASYVSAAHAVPIWVLN